jgi:chromosome segregation ATPase
MLCDICFKSFANSAIGTTIPCGHIFHMKCFEAWTADRRSARTRTKFLCPSCNESCSCDKPFIRLYLTTDSKNEYQIDNLDCKEDIDDEQMIISEASKSEASSQLWQDNMHQLRSLQTRIDQINATRFDLMDKVQQLEIEMLESTAQLDALTLESPIVRKDLKITRFELKTVNLALNHSNEKLQKSQKQSKVDLDRSRKALQMSQNQAKVSHRALARTTKELEELKQQIESLIDGSNLKQGRHVRNRSGKTK